MTTLLRVLTVAALIFVGWCLMQLTAELAQTRKTIEAMGADVHSLKKAMNEMMPR